MTLDLPQPYTGPVDRNAGLLCLMAFWRPNPQDPDPEHPGHKLSISLYKPLRPHDWCLCGSGRRYGACCRRLATWPVLSPDPDMVGYSLAQPQTATFEPVDVPVLRERLMADRRLRFVVAEPASTFWIYWGYPPVEDPYGIFCFGDLELRHDGRLVVSAMSGTRLAVLLDLLDEIAGELLPEPAIKRDPPVVLPKDEPPPRRPSPTRRRASRR